MCFVCAELHICVYVCVCVCPLLTLLFIAYIQSQYLRVKPLCAGLIFNHIRVCVPPGSRLPPQQVVFPL